MQYFMTQWYVFHSLSKKETLRIQNELQGIGTTYSMNGLILVAQEGCNGTVAGSKEAIHEIKNYLETQFGTLFFQDWESEARPFRRFKVDIRNEIVALKKPVPTPSHSSSTHLSPAEFHAMLQRGDVTILDTRNTYETTIGSFEGALIPNTNSFQEFPEFVATSNIPKNKPVAMYCTSGIRCEKASLEMKAQGFQEVYQLDGGITNYMKEYPEGHFKGECFVFDHRVAVDSNLQPSKRYGLCPSCGNPGDQKVNCMRCQKACTWCTSCLAQKTATCSRSCRAYLAQSQEKRG